MLTLWFYLLNQYLKVLILSTCAFIAILLTIRLDEIANFATMGSHFSTVITFTLYQIIYILPIALPIASLIASVMTLQTLSSSHEITALRASGLGLKYILAPILTMTLVLSFINFYIASELATQSHLKSGQLKAELKSINPLFLMHNRHLMKMKGFQYDSLGDTKVGEQASDVYLVLPNKNGRMNILLAKELLTQNNQFIGKNITYLASGKEDKTLSIENIAHVKMSLMDFSKLLQKKIWNLNNDHLTFKLLQEKISIEKDKVAATTSSIEKKNIQRNINKTFSEIARRISLGISLFTFTLLGAAFSITVGRNVTQKRLIGLIFFVSLYLIGFFLGKGVEQNVIFSVCLYIVPHFFMLLISIYLLRRTSLGLIS
ncbi:MAG: hypothetical protein BGO10_05215 [Chlamydia sp. 32-24]|nr:MAG: hypothetical protein BGO10_05215 [Chlamydia sp. 32-24]